MTVPRSDSPAPRPGDRLEVVIEKGVYRGLGLARHEGRVVMVPRALPGDRVRVRVESVERGFLRARAEAVLSPGAGRRGSPCPWAERCGGCAYQELDYAAQLELKGAVLRESLARGGVAWEGPLPLMGSPETGWRTRASLHLAAQGAGLALGLHEEGTHQVVDLPRCLQLSEPMMRAARGLRDALQQPGLANRARAIRHLDLAEAIDGRQLVMALETELDVKGAAALSGLAGAVPGLTGFGIVAGEGRARRFLSLHGDPHVHSTVAGTGLRAHVRSFFQANRFLVEPLTAAVLELAPGDGTVLDLYAGVGLFALPLARRVERVRAAEVNPIAVEDARWNAERAGLRNVDLFRGDVREALASWPAAAGESVVLDPPRTGAGAQVVRAVAGRRPAVVVYVSCDPPTLARDLKVFEAEGYRPDVMRAFDLFPDTFHVETVVRIRRA
jgi:23S rRNA (uracil1939-C5)-methyltransferase